MSIEKHWEMTFDLNTLEHLGVKLYTQYPLMVAELVSNSWDADADNVSIELFDETKKKIIISDDGHSMDFDELNNCFLNVGRNRRMDTQLSHSPKYKRPVLGKKGIGKLSMFGIANKITVTAIKNGKLNSFLMEYKEMKKCGGTYSPKPIKINEECSEADGTTIVLEELKRKSSFNPKELSTSLSKRFEIFNKINVTISHNNKTVIKIKNMELFNEIANQFKWSLPELLKDEKDELLDIYNYCIANQISGHIMTSKTPLKKNQQGVVLMARSKLVQENAFFDDRSNDYFHSYLYGLMNIDFIDEDNEEDFVATDRKSLVWEGETLEELKENLNKVLRFIEKKWRKERESAKKDEFKNQRGIDVDGWVDTLSSAEKSLGKKISNAILNNNSLDDDKAIMLFDYVQDAFSLKGFQDFAAQLDELGQLESELAIKLLDDWQFIEAKELAKLSKGRVATIEQFDKYITENVSETKVMQKFLEEFPWILEPRMTSFEREVTYSKWLKEHFPESDLPEKNKRIDFLCSNNSGTIYIIELKRPSIKISFKEIEQVSSYQEFIESKLPDTCKEVRVILISENHNYADGVGKMVETYAKSGSFEIKSYSDLLTTAKEYHKEFINKFEEIKKLKEIQKEKALKKADEKVTFREEPEKEKIEIKAGAQGKLF